jgi:hypothetical protein
MESSEFYEPKSSLLPEPSALCYTAFMRSGRTKTTSFSLDEETRLNLKALADRHHGGNVSALLAEFASREKKLLAAEAYFKTTFRLSPRPQVRALKLSGAAKACARESARRAHELFLRHGHAGRA